jgi:UDP-glucose 4-epimerase
MRILITGAGSYVGESVKAYLHRYEPTFIIDSVDTVNSAWKSADFSKYDVVYHVAGIAHVNADPKLEPLYYKVNRDLTIEIAKTAKACGVKQFIFMSSQIVFHESKSLKSEILNNNTLPNPNGFYGDSKLQAEEGLRRLSCDTFKICILRPPMIYGANSKGNFPRLVKLARKTPIFPNWHNKRSMLYIDNLAEFVRNAILQNLSGTFYPQNRELSDTTEIIRYFAKEFNHHIWITKALNPFVWLASFVLQPINKMFATYYYDSSMSTMDFDYQKVSLEESLKIIADNIKNKN